MLEKNELEKGPRAIRLDHVPAIVHARLKKYCDRIQYKEGRRLNKATAAIEILARATSKIKLDAKIINK